MSDLQRNSQAAGMTTAGNESVHSTPRRIRSWRRILTPVTVLAAALALVTGCQTHRPKFDESLVNEMGANANVIDTHSETIILREGDGVKITFPTAANLNAATTIRRDGNISLPLIGDMKAAGKTLVQLKADLLIAYKDQTDSKEVTVELVNSLFPIFVTGAVLQPHKVMSDHPISALETIMECGGFDYARANLKSVTVLRQEGTHLKSYHLNLKNLMQGKDEEPFYMKPSDIIYVKEKFTWF